MKPLSLCLTVAAASALSVQPVSAQETSRVSLRSTGGQSDGPCGTGPGHAVSISGDGSRVVFAASASDLVPGDTNDVLDIFVRDLNASSTVCVSRSTSGTFGDDWSTRPHISSNGRFVAFMSHATNLVPGDTNGYSDVFVHDLQSGQTSRESIGLGIVQGNLNSEWPSLSADGTLIAFWSNASNMVPGDTNATGDIFLRNRSMGTIERVSVGSFGQQGTGNSRDPFLSVDGEFVAFSSDSTNLVLNDFNGVRDVFLKRVSSGAVQRVGTWFGAPEPNGESTAPSISADNRYVAFTSEATNLVPGDTNGVSDIFVHDLVASVIERVSVGTGGAQADGASDDGRISEDGNHVVFTSEATNLVLGDTNGHADIFVRDLRLGVTRRASRSSTGAQGEWYSFYPALSADGRRVAFGSAASTLVPDDTNTAPDVFVNVAPPEPVLYCAGSRLGCPCFNDGTAPRGCANSTQSGGLLTWAGSTAVFQDDLSLEAKGLIPGQAALAFVGSSWINGGMGVAFGDGLRCVGGGTIRLGVRVPSATGEASWGPGLAAIGGWGPGDLRYFQIWYRDPVGPCGSGFNFTNGLEVEFSY